MTTQEFAAYVKSLQDCNYHHLRDLTPEVLASVVAVLEVYREETDTWEDTTAKIVVRLADGRVGVLNEWADSSGHGCQCDAGWTVQDSWEGA